MSRLRLNISKLKKLNKKGKVIINADMSKYCTYKCGGKARILMYVNTFENFIKLMSYFRDKEIPYYVIGNGSNLLISDKGYKGIVLKLGGDFARIEQESETSLECGGGVTLAKLFAYCLENGLSGLEDGAGIPATVGGAVCMNASAYNYETAKIVEYVVAYVNGKIEYFDRKNCCFGYRTSIFQNTSSIILRVGLSFVKSDKDLINDRFIQIAQKRLETQPLDKFSAGSVFKKLDGISISQLLDEAQLKGLTIGRAQVSLKHANFIINLGGAKSQDIYDLIKLVQTKILDKYKIKIDTEIKFLGEFK